jgi:acetylornithine deacetylase/succinyl-diaminopimelate desuccinylase-like protein
MTIEVMPSPMIDLLADMVAIDSVNPSLVSGGAGEREVAAYVADWARDAGLEVELLEATPGRPSVVVRARGTGGGRLLLLCGHYDTVTVEGMRDPSPRVEGDRLHGRGAYDMKAGVAAALIACREAAGLGLAGDVIVAAVADEEHASLRVQEVLATVRADAAIVTEPTELELVVAHKGFVWSEIEVTGRAAHGSRPHPGVDAIVKAGPILVGLGAPDAELGARTHPLLGRGSVHASVIQGGEELSSYPARCVLGLERRTLPGFQPNPAVRPGPWPGSGQCAPANAGEWRSPAARARRVPTAIRKPPMSTLVPASEPTIANAVTIGSTVPTQRGTTAARRIAIPRSTLPANQVKIATGAATPNQDGSSPVATIVAITTN